VVVHKWRGEVKTAFVVRTADFDVTGVSVVCNLYIKGSVPEGNMRLLCFTAYIPAVPAIQKSTLGVAVYALLPLFWKVIGFHGYQTLILILFV
jgi:hypothetical protein